MNMETRDGMIEYVKQVAEKNNWILIKDDQMFTDLIVGLVDNKKANGYQSCPCRLASGKRDEDRDLICPCDYASPDIEEHGACYCNLYLKHDFYEKGVDFIVVPERRPIVKEEAVRAHFSQNK